MKVWQTPFGRFDLEIGEHGVSAVSFSSGTNSVTETERERVDRELADRLDEHLHGRPASLQLDLQGLTPMAQVALAKLLEIPHGEVRSYSWVAREIGRPRAVRPVASFVAKNPIPLLIPCHRVVRSDGFIGNFSLQTEHVHGPELKKQLLAFEGLDVDWVEGLARRGVRYLADKETNVFHVPSCKKGPLPGSPTMVELKTAADAADAYYEPCQRCRPL